MGFYTSAAMSAEFLDDPMEDATEAAFEAAWLHVAENALAMRAIPAAAAVPVERPDCRCAWCNHCRSTHLPLACRVLDCRCLQFI